MLKTELNTYHANISKIISEQSSSKFMVIDKKNAPIHGKNLELREKTIQPTKKVNLGIEIHIVKIISDHYRSISHGRCSPMLPKVP